MKITVDLNVLLDVAQNRLPHYHSSEEVLHRARAGEYEAVLPAHAITTLHYILEKWSNAHLANQTIDGLLSDFIIPIYDKATFQRARKLQMKDFEDAVVASIAEASGSDYLITRNVPDFEGSPVPAMTPTEFLETLAETEEG